MRIVLVGNFGLGYKGTMAARAMPIARELARRGHDVTIRLPDDGSETPAPAAVDGVDVRPVRAWSGASPRGENRRAFVGNGSSPGPFEIAGLSATIVWEALRLRPDVLYAFKPIGYAALSFQAAWAVGKPFRRQTLLMVDTDDWEGSGGWADRAGTTPFRRAVVNWQERWCLIHADVVTVASRELERLVPTPRSRVVYAPNAASPDSPGWVQGNPASLRSTLGLTDAPIVLVYTRFVEFAPDRLAATASAILGQNAAAHFVVVGKGLAGEEQQFAKIMADRGLGQRTHHLGWLKPEDLPDVFAAADLALYPLDDTLLNRAKCPMKLVDLILAGVPVVADAVGQATEYIQDGVTGLLVPSGDVAAMADRARDLLDDRPRRVQMGARARARLLDSWTWSKQTDVIDQAMREAVARRRAPLP